MADHIRADRRVDPSVLQDLVPCWREFGIRLPGDLVVLSRALVTLEGTLRVIAPGCRSSTAATEIDDLAAGPHRSTATTMIRDEMLAALHTCAGFPTASTASSRSPVVASCASAASSTRTASASCAPSSTGRCSSATGAAFLAVAAVLLVAADHGPTVGGDAGLFEVFGYFGLFVGTVLLLRVAAAVARDGTT